MNDTQCEKTYSYIAPSQTSNWEAFRPLKSHIIADIFIQKSHRFSKNQNSDIIFLNHEYTLDSKNVFVAFGEREDKGENVMSTALLKM